MEMLKKCARNALAYLRRPPRTHLRNAVAFFCRPPGKHIGLTAVALGVLGLLLIGIAWTEYRTNWVAERLGVLLVRTNPLRPATGPVWQQLQAQTRTRQTIEQTEPVSLHDLQTGLPVPVRNSRFQIERVPQTGPPGYAALWKTPLPDIDLNDRDLGDIATSLRIYKQGLALVRALDLPDVQFHPQVRAQVEALYTQLGIPDIAEPDTLSGDSLGVLNPDSLRAAVFLEIAAETVPGLKQKEKAALVRDYENGRVLQLILNRDLGRYRGELHRDNAAPIAFTLSNDAVTRIFDIAEPDTTEADN